MPFQQLLFKYSVTFCSLLLPVLLSISLLFTGCKKDEVQAQPGNSQKPADAYLVSSTLIGTYQPSDISRRMGSSAVNLLTRFPVKVYKLVYRTVDAAGNPVQASGALVVPVANQSVPLLSQQHGTITNDNAAPSNYKSNSEVWTAGTVLGSAGYVVAAPDYLGYGEAKNISHPYEHRATLASASRDMLRAAREFCTQQKVALNNQLFLTGYSEGGYATMSLHKLLEEKHGDEFTVTASAPGAGAYHKTAFARYLLNTDQTQQYVNSYLWVLQTYNRVYSLNRPTSYYIKEPFATRVDQSGTSANVDTNPQKLFTDEFKSGVLTGTDTRLLEALADNDVHNWQPKAPIALFHGTADDFVPFFNSQDAYDAMRKQGATQVELIPIKDGNHFTAVAQFALGMLGYFEQHRQNDKQ